MASAEEHTILVVDDSRIQAKMLEDFLKKAGYKVQVAYDGAMALEQVQASKPDAIISDIEMPKMNGYDFCRSIKQNPNTAELPVILLSTLAEPEDIIRGLDAGADNYVSKPYDPKYLISRLESIMQTPISSGEEDSMALKVTLGGQQYHVKAGRQQVLNLLVSTFENAVEKNRELHRANEQLTLAKEKLTQWNSELESLNSQITQANERMSRDLKAAARVQQSLLPDGNTDVPHVQIAWKYIPCDELAGDFLNCFMLSDKELALFVVDVSGHGAASSLLSVAVGRLLTPQSSATSLLVRPDPFSGRAVITPPATVLEELNRRFPMEGQGGLYFTIIYAVLNVESGELTFASGGHPPIVHIPKGGEPVTLESTGFPVGWMDDAEYDEHRIQLAPGDRLFLYSDGIPEAMDAEMNQLGEPAMMKHMAQTANDSLPNAVDALFDTVKTWCTPNGPKDDVSILGVQRQTD